MIKKVFLIGAGLIFSTSLLSAQEESSFSKYGLEANLGTPGVGIKYSTNISDNLDLKIGVNGFTYNHTGTESNINYDIDLKLFTVSALVDYHPFNNGFIISSGVMYNGNKVDYKGRPIGGTYDIGGTIYNATDVGSLTGKVSFNDVAPYLGIGYNSVLSSSGLHFTADLGVMYQGEPDSSLSVTCGSALTAAQCTQLQQDVFKEKQEFDDSIKGYKFYPVLSFGIAYRF